MRLAFSGLVVPFWSEEIRSEWIRSLLRDYPELKLEKLERTCQEMDFHFPHALVQGYESITSVLQLPDPNDRHVLAVAIHVKAEYIVTFNLKDFPKSTLIPHKVEAISPDDFALRVIEYDSQTFITAVAKHRAFLVRPPKTVDEYLATLEQQRLFKTVAFLREHRADI